MQALDPSQRNSNNDANNQIEYTAKPLTSHTVQTYQNHLTRQEIRNLVFCFAAWAFNVSIVTLGMSSINPIE
jgi:hypothetical protein